MSVLRTGCTSKDRVCLVIIDSGSFENCVSLEMVQKLDLKMDPHPKPYKLSWLHEGSDIKVKHWCLLSLLQLESTTMTRYGVMLFQWMFVTCYFKSHVNMIVSSFMMALRTRTHSARMGTKLS